MCTRVCGKGFSGKSCLKICLVNVYPHGHHEERKRMYVILDDQSNVSLAKTEFFDAFKIQGPSIPYILTTCARVVNVSGRRAHGYVVEPLTGEFSINLPTLIECNNVPNSRAEFPTPEAAYHHSHMRAIAHEIPALDSSADILLALGRDSLPVHTVRHQFNGPLNAPFSQRHALGWVIVGDICLNGAHTPDEVNAFKTSFMEEDFSQGFKQSTSLPRTGAPKQQEEHSGRTVFLRTETDSTCTFNRRFVLPAADGQGIC